jgi:hypothetical protein
MKQLKMFRLSPALIVASIALFVAMGGVGVAALKLTPNSVKTKNIKNAAVTGGKLADGAVSDSKVADGAISTAKFAPNAEAPNAAMLDGVRPGGCHVGWIKGTLVVDTSIIDPASGEATVPGFDCANKADDAIQIKHEATGIYTVTFDGNDAGSAVASSAGNNSVTAATKVSPGVFTVKTWSNATGAFIDNTSFSLLAY